MDNSSNALLERFEATYRLLKQPVLSQMDDCDNSGDEALDSFDDSSDVKHRSSLVSHSRLQSHRILKRAPLGAYVTVTSSEGDRVYLRLKSEEKAKKSQRGLSHTPSGLQLLTVPFSQLRDSVEEEVHSIFYVCVLCVLHV